MAVSAWSPVVAPTRLLVPGLSILHDQSKSRGPRCRNRHDQHQAEVARFQPGPRFSYRFSCFFQIVFFLASPLPGLGMAWLTTANPSTCSAAKHLQVCFRRSPLLHISFPKQRVPNGACYFARCFVLKERNPRIYPPDQLTKCHCELGEWSGNSQDSFSMQHGSILFGWV
jgi:hypothetical protein